MFLYKGYKNVQASLKILKWTWLKNILDCWLQSKDIILLKHSNYGYLKIPFLLLETHFPTYIYGLNQNTQY